jgi:hypothetical protein
MRDLLTAVKSKLSKKNSKAIIKTLSNIALVCVIAISSVGFIQKPAAAGDLGDIWNQIANFGSYYGHPWRQYYFASYSPQQTAQIQRDYGNQAQSQFDYGCREAYYNLSGYAQWQRVTANLVAWFFYTSRVEGNQANCYYRKFNY